MLNIASGRRARTELASSARAPRAERIEDRSRRLVIPRNVGGKRLTGESQFGTRSVIRFAESDARRVCVAPAGRHFVMALDQRALLDMRDRLLAAVEYG